MIDYSNYDTIEFITASDSSRLAVYKMLRDVYEGEHKLKKVSLDYKKNQIFDLNLSIPYLLRREHMTQNPYRNYVYRASLTNIFAATVDTLSEMVLSKGIEYTKSNNTIRELLENCTLEEETFEELAHSITHDILLTGRVGVLVDADENGNNPYCSFYPAESILKVQKKKINNRYKVSEIVLFEENDEGIYNRILKLNDDNVYTQELIKRTAKVSNSYKPSQYTSEVVFSEREIRISGNYFDEIPFVFFNARNNKPEEQSPPLQKLAELNLAHFRDSAELQYGKTYTMPTYFHSTDVKTSSRAGSKVQDTKSVTLDFASGAGQLISGGGDLKLLEFNGQGLNYFVESEKNYIFQMSLVGAKIISSANSSTAHSDNELTLKSEIEKSMIIALLRSLNNGLNRILIYLLKASNITPPKGFKIEIQKPYKIVNVGSRELNLIRELYDNGVVPYKMIYKIYKDFGELLPQGYTYEEFLKDLDIVEETTSKQQSNNLKRKIGKEQENEDDLNKTLDNEE